MAVIAMFITRVLIATTEAHELTALPSTDAAWQWQFEPWVVILLLLSLGLYVAGWLHLLHRTENRHGVQRRELIAFTAGWLALLSH